MTSESASIGHLVVDSFHHIITHHVRPFLPAVCYSDDSTICPELGGVSAARCALQEASAEKRYFSRMYSHRNAKYTPLNNIYLEE